MEYNKVLNEIYGFKTKYKEIWWNTSTEFPVINFKYSKTEKNQ